LKDSKTARKAPARGKKPEPPRKKAPAPRAPDTEKAIEEFSSALRHFHKRDLARAREELKELISKYPNERELRDRAQTYLQVCERGLVPPSPRLKEADDYYYQGVVNLNARNLDEAIRMFEKALTIDGSSEKTVYGLAAAQSLSGRAVDAVASLRRAVAMNPASRYRAAGDPDFEPLKEDPEFRAIVRGQRGGGM
jgi:tetratricopeptide (TPR) repeat protein